jgi:peptidoglycan hydrolase CwlO-like protein
MSFFVGGFFIVVIICAFLVYDKFFKGSDKDSKIAKLEQERDELQGQLAALKNDIVDAREERENDKKKIDDIDNADDLDNLMRN